MTIIILKCTSASTATQVVSDVEGGELFGVDMGTTSSSSSYSQYAAVQCTKTRAESLVNAVGEQENCEICMFDSTPESFSDADGAEKMWYLRGKL
tara:strand:+ start:100 stop:384 length:285 start_codon:yes stop_codon:yes gene_type:complete